MKGLSRKAVKLSNSPPDLSPIFKTVVLKQVNASLFMLGSKDGLLDK